MYFDGIYIYITKNLMMHAWKYADIHWYTNIHMYVYIYMCVYVHIHTTNKLGMYGLIWGCTGLSSNGGIYTQLMDVRIGTTSGCHWMALVKRPSRVGPSGLPLLSPWHGHGTSEFHEFETPRYNGHALCAIWIGNLKLIATDVPELFIVFSRTIVGKSSKLQHWVHSTKEHTYGLSKRLSSPVHISILDCCDDLPPRVMRKKSFCSWWPAQAVGRETSRNTRGC